MTNKTTFPVFSHGLATNGIKVLSNPGTGINDEKEEDILTLYTNPAAETLYLKGAGSENAVISIFNILGTKVWSGTVKGKSIDVSHLPAPDNR
jgi:hypothetical protein